MLVALKATSLIHRSGVTLNSSMQANDNVRMLLWRPLHTESTCKQHGAHQCPPVHKLPPTHHPCDSKSPCLLTRL